MSTLSLAKNGYVLSSKQTKHIKANTSSFVTIINHNSRELDLRYCPTKLMWADVLTKPLQGAKFRVMRAFLMDCPVDYYKEPPFIPSPHPTLASTMVLPPKSVSLSLPSPNKSFARMKPRVPLTTPSSWGGGCWGDGGKAHRYTHQCTRTSQEG